MHKMKVNSKEKSPLSHAASYIDRKQRTQAEVEDFLYSLDISEVEVMTLVERLKSAALIDDEKYAENYIGSRLATKPMSRASLKRQLLSHFIDETLVDRKLFELVTDEIELENAVKCAGKYMTRYVDYDSFERNNRTIKRLLSMGFDYDTARRCVSLVSSEENGI